MIDMQFAHHKKVKSKEIIADIAFFFFLFLSYKTPSDNKTPQ